jgi:hypothetical protein
LSHDGRASLRKLLTANKRLNVAYLLKESFGQLWSYQTEGWARAFFDRWKEGLNWQRLVHGQVWRDAPSASRLPRGLRLHMKMGGWLRGAACSAGGHFRSSITVESGIRTEIHLLPAGPLGAVREAARQ